MLSVYEYVATFVSAPGVAVVFAGMSSETLPQESSSVVSDDRSM